jgi:signal transduction histidine kinase/CheY-like chemotaxis protein
MTLHSTLPYLISLLNAPFLLLFSVGLKLVCDDLDTTTDEKDIEHYETLLGVQSACKSAVEILNDLLCFDKLESGILEMHKLDVSVIPFICNCVNMFSSQAKEAGIDISYITGRPYVTQEHGALLESDTVLMDKFKMDQVLRNLISNALKFTPRGGSVTVSASFVPDEDRDVLQSASVVKGDLGKGGTRASRSLTFPFPFRFPYPCGMSPKIFVNTSTDTNVEAAEGHIISIHEAPVDIDASHDDLNGPAIITSTRLSLTNTHAHPPSDLPDNNPVSGGHDVGRDGSKGKTPAPDREVQHIWNPHNRRSSSCNPGLGPLDGMHKVVTGKLRFSVTDTGCGISDANQVRLFKEIVQFNPELLQAGGGSGLGLWITSSIVQMHNGSVQAFSAGAGKGSTFTVEIDMHRLVNRACSPDPSPSPSHRPPPETGHSPSVHSPRVCSSNDTPRPHDSSTARDTEPLSPPNTSPWGSTQDESSPLPRRMHPRVILVEGATERGYRTPGDRPDGAMSLDYSLKHDVVHDILVVDDSTLNRKLLCKVLKSSGYSCEEAADGLCAVDKVKWKMASKSGNYDVILMDFVMPKMDGPAATQAIRALGYSGPIFGLTGNALSSDMKYFTDHGANAVLAKPFDFTTFKQLLKKTKESTVTHVVATTSI